MSGTPDDPRPIQQGEHSGLTLVVIYERPRDFPDHYVVRRQHVHKPGVAAPVHIAFDTQAVLLPTLDAARSYVFAAWPDAMQIQGTGDDDDPCIVGVFI